MSLTCLRIFARQWGRNTRRPVGNRSAHPGTHRIRSDLRKNFGEAKRNILHLIRSDHSDGACASRRVCCSWWRRKQGKDFSWHCYMCCSTSKDSSWLVLKEEFCRLVNCSFFLNYSWHYVWPLFDFVCGVDTRRSSFLGVSSNILHQNEWFERCIQRLTTGI